MLKTLHQLVLWFCLALVLLSSCSNPSRQAQACSSLNERWAASPTSEEALFPIFQNGKWGFINLSGQVIIEPKFDIVERFSENRAPFGSRSNGKWGFIDSTGKVVVEPRFDNVGSFFGGRASVKIGSRTGFIDPSGKEIGRRFVKVSGFREGRAFGQGGDFQWRMFDFDGNFVNNDSFSSVGGFSEGLSAFSNRNYTEQSGFLDREGRVVLELDGIHPDTEGYGFSNGLALVYARKPYYWYHFLNLSGWADLIWGYINENGKQIIPPKYDGASEFSECLATVWVHDLAGVINTEGRMIVQPKFNSIRSFSEGLAVVQEGEFSNPSTRYGYIDQTGKIVIEPQFSSADDFREGLAVVQDKTSGKKGVIDKTGKFVIEPQFDDASSFRGGLARVESSGKSGYINRSGAFIWTD